MELSINSKKYGIITYIIDDEDYDKIKNYRWNANYDNHKNSFRIKTASGLRLHRIIMNAKNGEYVDHIDGNILNNRKSNLRICTLAENNRNKSKSNKKMTSKYKGVTFQSGKYRVRIRYNNKYLSIGMFDTQDKAAIAYNIAALKYYGEFAKLNNVMEV